MKKICNAMRMLCDQRGWQSHELKLIVFPDGSGRLTIGDEEVFYFTTLEGLKKKLGRELLKIYKDESN